MSVGLIGGRNTMLDGFMTSAMPAGLDALAFKLYTSRTIEADVGVEGYVIRIGIVLFE